MRQQTLRRAVMRELTPIRDVKTKLTLSRAVSTQQTLRRPVIRELRLTRDVKRELSLSSAVSRDLARAEMS